MTKTSRFKLSSVFLLGSQPSFINDDGLGFVSVNESSEQHAQIEKILDSLDVETTPPLIVRNERDLANLDVNVDAFLLFVHCIKRFPSLIALATTGKRIILTSEEGAAGHILDAYEYLSEYENVTYALTFPEVRRKIRVLKAVKHIKATKVGVFDAGKRSLKEIVWHKNPLLTDKFDTTYINIQDFKRRYQNVDETKAKNLAKAWMSEAEVREPTLEDVTQSARVYLAMKHTIEKMGIDVAYVLWCSQFNSMLGTKMCFAISKLNDVGLLTGCWRGGNLLPMLVLNTVAKKPVFFGEVHMYEEGIISLRHCAVPQTVADCQYVLRRWRDREGTVTGYCNLPEGEVTIVNAGQGDTAVVMQGTVIDSRDLGGENCRTTVWIELEDKTLVPALIGREFAMVYGSYKAEAKDVVTQLGIKVK
ncbi:MAG: hypothetical protein GWO20_00765 [Candidatus Korarchaeota archaeon]|nr:hypothetical protein [Candidatus Korarchaeota archaeon]NIU82113.1 hypothetical protein [Candidatus Thorarchaeota archaeon]